MNLPDNLKYTKTHEWLKMEGDTATVGLTDYAQEQLTDIIFADLPETGSHYDAGDEITSVESVKAVGYINAPVAGTVEEVNQALKDEPEKINQDPYGEGWLLKIKTDNADDAENLLSADQYKEFLESEENKQ